jgi:hypothetical protein
MANFIFMEIIKHEKPLPSLVFCIVMDVIGCATYILPVVAEFIDIVWAPISAYIFYKTFGGRVGQIGAVLNFIEEIIPGTDIIPSFTIAYFYKKHFMEAKKMCHKL